VCSTAALDRDRLVLKGNPPEASLPAPSEFGLLHRSTGGQRIRRIPAAPSALECRSASRPSGGRLKFTLTGPTLIAFEGVPLCAVAMIPDEVDRARGGVEPLSRRLVLDAPTTSNGRQARLEPGRLSPPAKRKRSGWRTGRRTGSRAFDVTTKSVPIEVRSSLRVTCQPTGRTI
jgi:hypothetical protein